MRFQLFKQRSAFSCRVCYTDYQKILRRHIWSMKYSILQDNRGSNMKTEIESEQTKLGLEIPKPYELSENEDGDRTFACFERSGSSDMVFSFLLEADEEDFQDAEDYIRREFADNCAENKCKTKICEQAYLQGRMYYYYIVSFKDMHARFQKLVAACDIRPGEIYTVDTDWVDKKEVLTIDAVSPFLKIAVSDKE